MTVSPPPSSFCLLLFGITISILPVSRAWILHWPIAPPSTKAPSLSSTTGDDSSSAVDLVEYDDSQARSQFGTRDYWDELYQGRGDFPANEYQWYYGWGTVGPLVRDYLPQKAVDILVLGIGNDPILLDLLQAGYTRLTAVDYSEHALERQRDLLEFGASSYDTSHVETLQMDARCLDPSWTDRFDLILEKGCLDAIYLSGDGYLEQVEPELSRVLKSQAKLISISGVVPAETRGSVFQKERWTWLLDGTNDLKAGRFVLTPKTDS